MNEGKKAMSMQVSVREAMHIKYCREGACFIKGLPGDPCKTLNFLIDQLEEQAIHREARKLIDIHMDSVLKHGAQVGQGIAFSVGQIDPYCTSDGVNYVRKLDGSPVRIDNDSKHHDASDSQSE